MAEVIKFPKTAKVVKAPLKIEAGKINKFDRGTIKTIVLWLWCILRLPIYIVLLWLRLPVMFVCNILSVPLLIGWLFSWYAFPDKTNMVWSLGGASFIFFTAMFLYDYLLMLISPFEMLASL